VTLKRVLCLVAILFPPWMPDDLRYELQRLYERPPVIAAPLPAAAAIDASPCLPDDCLEFMRALELTTAIATPVVVPTPAVALLPVAAITELHFILPTGHSDVSGWYFHDSRFPADGPQHTGLDYACSEGDPIYAAASGTITSAQLAGDFGNRVIIRHAGGWETRYCHLSQCAAWGWVAQGAIIGYCGNTGLSTGAHLHYEARLNGVLVDPAGLP